MSLVAKIKPGIKTEHVGRILYKKDPMKKLIEKRLINQIGNGIFVLQGELVDLINIIDREVYKIALKVKSKSVYVPSILSWENTKNSHYLDSFSNQALVIDKYFKQKASIHEHDGIISPTVCYHYFSLLKNSTITHNFSINALSRCARYEEGILNDLSRLINFSMREVVFFGEEKYCLKKREELLKNTLEMMDKVFDLSYSVVTASDPFFGKGSEIKKKAQMLMESKYEIQASLPYKNSSISVASFNYHGKVFYERFSIKSSKPALNFSGCIGWGYERILCSILSQKGVNFSSDYYKKLFKSYKNNEK
jgi:seryl-tRNA synthetase